MHWPGLASRLLEPYAWAEPQIKLKKALDGAQYNQGW